MLLFPYKADVNLGRLPILTLIVCAVCIWIFARQAMSWHTYEKAVGRYCNSEVTREERLVLRYLTVPANTHYCDLLLKIRKSPNRSAMIRQLADDSKPTPFYSKKSDSVDYIYTALEESSQRFESSIPHNLTDRLHFDPKHPTVMTMLTAAFSHGSWWHLASNLIFFFAFAASVEVIIGYLYYFGFIVLSAAGTHLAYRYSVAGVENALPTVGLSGIVMAMMAFLATVAPGLRIRCFFWFLIFVRIFRVPALAIAALYIAENVYDFIQSDPDSHINYVAHISGAAIGVIMGLLYRTFKGADFETALQR
jgi:membrane associated rhomboid family serine protease